EMSWGEWEGRVLDELRQELGDLMAILEAEGLDFKGPNGESPREVQRRVMPLLKEIASSGNDTLAVCHKGVIRAIFAMADNWSMVDKPKHKLRDGCLQLFELDACGHPKISQLNIDMTT
ncbi:MAG: histidine phosphatase family protein, partial [Rhodospirillales bacterium]|nr:histidine phosphatase family protein [Rhodospirillales bacterium]